MKLMIEVDTTIDSAVDIQRAITSLTALLPVQSVAQKHESTSKKDTGYGLVYDMTGPVTFDISGKRGSGKTTHALKILLQYLATLKSGDVKAGTKGYLPILLLSYYAKPSYLLEDLRYFGYTGEASKLDYGCIRFWVDDKSIDLHIGTLYADSLNSAVVYERYMAGRNYSMVITDGITDDVLSINPKLTTAINSHPIIVKTRLSEGALTVTQYRRERE